jgi:hypothetical protein
LLVNGASLGAKTSADCIFRWPEVRLRAGINAIEARARHDGRALQDRCEWTYTPADS